MNQNENQILQFENYLGGKLSPEEESKFLQSLDSDPVLKEEFGLYQAAFNASKIAGREDLRHKLELIEAAYPSSGKRKGIFSNKFRRAFAVAAGILLILVPVWFVFSPGHVDTDILFSHYYEPYREPVNIRSGSTEQDALRFIAVEAYSSKNYEGAIDAYEELLDKEEYYLDHFYYAQSILSFGIRTDRAVFSLLQVLETDNDYHDQAEWYLGLAYLRLGEISESKIYLQKIARNNGHFQSEKAAELLKKIRKS